MSGNLPVSGLEDIVQPISIGDLMIISQDTSSGFMSAQMNVGEFLAQVFEENSSTGGKLSDLATELADLENRVGVLETNQAIKDLVEAVFHVGSKHMSTSIEWNPGEALRKFFGKRTNWVLYPYVPYGVVSENVPLGGIVPLLKGTGRSAANLRIWERLPDNAGNYRVNITPDKTAINEGDTVTFTITMIGVEPGTLVNYQFLAIDAADLDPNSEAKLEGSFINSGSGVNTLTLKTVPNRRNDGDRIVSLNIPSYQAVGTFVLVDSSKALDGVINVLPGTSQLITLAPNQQADVWITGGGGSGGISKTEEAEVAKEVNFLSTEVRGGKTETISIAAGEEVELWMWGGGGHGATTWKATYTLPQKYYGNGKPSKLTIGSAVFVAGGGLGYLESAVKVKNGYKYIEAHLPGGTNSIVSGDYGGLEVTILENVNGSVGSNSRFFISSIWYQLKLPALQFGTLGKLDIIGNAHGSGGTGTVSVPNPTDTYNLGGGGTGGFIKLRVKNPTNSLITINAEAGEKGVRKPEGEADYENIALDLAWYSQDAQHGAIQVIRGSTNTVVKVDPNESKDIVIPAGKSAEIWIAGGGGAAPLNVNMLTKGNPAEITIGTAKYIANGGGNSAYFPGSGSGGPEPGPVSGVNVIPTAGLPSGVTVEVLLNQPGVPTQIVKNIYNVWTEYTSEKSYIYGYGPFAGAANTDVHNLLGTVNRAPAAGSLMKLLVKNNNTTPLTIPANVGALSIAWISVSENPGVFVDKYEMMYEAHGSPGVVLAFIEGVAGNNGGAVYSQVVVTQESVGYNGEWSYVAFQSPLISGSSSPYIEETYWATDEAGLNRITGSNPYGDHAYFIIKTIDVEGSVILSLASSGLTQDEMGGGELGKEITIPITKIGTTNKGIGSYLIQTLDDDEMSFRNSKYVGFVVGTERVAGTDYVNNTDYTIEVILMVSDVGTVKPFKVTVGDYAPVDVRDLGDPGYDQQFTVIVPPGVKYRVDANGNIIRKWSELRYKGLK